MNTQALKCFLRVAERLNFTRAAEELYLSTPTVTHHIQKLEEELGVQLFYRDSKSVRLTNEGETFYQDANEIMMKMDDAVSHLNNIKAKKQTVLRIGCTTAADTSFLTEPLLEFHKRIPEAEPHILMHDFADLLAMMHEKHLDIILGTRDMLASQNEFRFISLLSCRSYAVFNKKYPFSKKEISLKDMEAYPLLALRVKSVPLRHDDRIEQFLNANKTIQHITRHDDPLAVITLVKSGYGIGILPEYAISKQDRNELSCIQIKESPSIEYGLIVRKDKQNQCVKGLIDILLGK